MKKIVLYTLLLITSLIFVSCDSFLDVEPADKLTREQIASSEGAINSVLNGIYMNMTKEALYGGNLTKSTMDVLAQRYTFGTDSKWYKYSQYDYSEKEVDETFTNVWSAAYTQILDINELIDILNITTVIPQSRKNILLGEAYALRAFHHFDLLRIFGPVYNTSDSTSLCIPYNNSSVIEMQPLLPANVVLNNVMADLGKAETLLQNDPVKTVGVDTTTTNDPLANFYKYRNHRMNYFAVKAMQARAYLWRGDKTNAFVAAQEVINAGGPFFDFTPYQNVITGTNPDRIFSTEVLFGLENRNYGKDNPDMYTLQDKYFAADLTETSLLYTRPNRLTGGTGCFDSDADYRYKYLWLISSTGGKSYRTFFKYARPTNVNLPFAYIQPLIRITEMYYIAAECNPNFSVGLTLLNLIRPHRGLNTISLGSTAALQAEILKEYNREFYGEGQLFFYYKHLNLGTINNGSLDNGTISMNPTKYQVPLPLSERNLR